MLYFHVIHSLIIKFRDKLNAYFHVIVRLVIKFRDKLNDIF